MHTKGSEVSHDMEVTFQYGKQAAEHMMTILPDTNPASIAYTIAHSDNGPILKWLADYYAPILRAVVESSSEDEDKLIAAFWRGIFRTLLDAAPEP